MTDLILIGKQGCGKGTQAKILAEKFGFKIFETGGELRAIAQQDTELGREVKDITTRGDLVSNDIVMRIVENFLENLEGDAAVIFDGIPRSEEQRQSLEKLLAEKNRAFRVLEITLSDEATLARLTIRAKCNACGANFGSKDDVCPKCGATDISRRADDNPESITKRLQNFESFTAPLLKVWGEQDRVVSVDGEQPVDQVTVQIHDQLGL